MEGGLKGLPRRPVASFRLDEEPEAPGRTGGLEASVAVLATQVEFMMAELRMIREGRPEVGRGDAAVEPEVGAVGDVAHRPSQWARVVAQGKTEAERQLRVDSLLLHIDRDHRVGELRSGGLPAQASARAMESIGTTLRAIARSPGESEHLAALLQPAAKLLYTNLLLLTHGPEAAGRWSAAITARTSIEESYVAAFQSLPPALRRPREEKSGGGWSRWQPSGRGMRGPPADSRWSRGRNGGRGFGGGRERMMREPGWTPWEGSGEGGDRGRRGGAGAAPREEQNPRDPPRRG